MKTAPAKRARPLAVLQPNIAGATLPPARQCSRQAGIAKGSLGRGGSCDHLCICREPWRDGYAPIVAMEDQSPGPSAAMSRRLGRGRTSLPYSCSAALTGSDIDQEDERESAHRSMPAARQWAAPTLVGAGCLAPPRCTWSARRRVGATGPPARVSPAPPRSAGLLRGG